MWEIGACGTPNHNYRAIRYDMNTGATGNHGFLPRVVFLLYCEVVTGRVGL